MLSVKSTTLNNTKTFLAFRLLFGVLFLNLFFTSSAQENSPYSRYGIGDLTPNTNILNRGMGGISAAYSDWLSVNFTNPASYSLFKTFIEQKTKKPISGRVILDAGINFDNRTLREANNPQKFTSPNAFFSYLQLGIPVKPNWGISLGLRPVSKISYRIFRGERLFDPVTQLPIDSAVTEFTGEGGAFLASAGTGIAIGNFSAGINFGYLFGKKDYSSRRSLINDSVQLQYIRGHYRTRTSLGDIFWSGGIQYKIDLNKEKKTSLKLGAFGNLEQNINAKQDIVRETFVRSGDNGDTKLDSVFEQNNVKGTMVYPSGLGIGFILEKEQPEQGNEGGWQAGVDFITNNWNSYRFFGAGDAVQNSWELRAGAQIKPSVSSRNYWSYVSYRGGVFVGQDYINVSGKLPVFGVSFGAGLPVLNLKDAGRRFRTQYTIVNISFEYISRGNNNNLLKESLFRFSAGFSLSDLWFSKRKYE